MKRSGNWVDQTNEKHGGSRPVTREDDKRIEIKEGYTKLVAMRFESKEEEKEVMNLTPRTRVQKCLSQTIIFNEQD